MQPCLYAYLCAFSFGRRCCITSARDTRRANRCSTCHAHLFVPKLLSIFLTAQQAEASQVPGSKTCVHVTVHRHGLGAEKNGRQRCWLSSLSDIRFCVVQLITEIPFTGTGDTTYYADDYTITTCTDSSGISETIGSPVRHLICCQSQACLSSDLHLHKEN